MKNGIWIKIVICVLCIIIGILGCNYYWLKKDYQLVSKDCDKYEQVANELLEENLKNKRIIDSLTIDIEELQKDIHDISKSKYELESKLEQFEFKTNLDENVILLKENIWNYSH